MYRYTVMAVATAIIFAVVYIILTLIFGTAIDWSGLLFESIAFGIIMTVIQYYSERNKNNIEEV
ncbi:hypothetical protein SAMN05216463_11311 [Xylanibacter ruminicola]|uniref:Uncharacterized protein n=2 Tax=Xylanibacter ruminicola TaxID=839 RepID=A0A1M6VKF6_XYLRU|nr:hypothetical protein SAMN05216463_11311 [Xylanibacter ruminicola]